MPAMPYTGPIADQGLVGQRNERWVMWKQSTGDPLFPLQVLQCLE
jgi:hypothetical protein